MLLTEDRKSSSFKNTKLSFPRFNMNDGDPSAMTFCSSRRDQTGGLTIQRGGTLGFLWELIRASVEQLWRRLVRYGSLIHSVNDSMVLEIRNRGDRYSGEFIGTGLLLWLLSTQGWWITPFPELEFFTGPLTLAPRSVSQLLSERGTFFSRVRFDASPRCCNI